jgi:predicted glutamine amidotransferase
MCRVLLAKASGVSGMNLLNELIRYHYLSSSNDPLLAELTGGDGRHCHGFGSVLLVDYGHGWRVYYTRYDAADHYGVGEESCKINLEELGQHAEWLKTITRNARRAILLLHSRRASKGMPRGIVNTHPFHVQVPSGTGARELFLMHNGSMYHSEMAKDLKINPSKYTDSYVLAMWIAERIRQGMSLVDALQEGSRFIKGGYIVGSLLLGPKGFTRIAYSGLWRKDSDEKRIRYYTPYLVVDEGVRALVSSTIKLHAEAENINLDFKPISEIGYL